VTLLRQSMLDELQRHDYSPNTVRSSVHPVEDFARYFLCPPEQLGSNHVSHSRSICLAIASCPHAPSKDGEQRCDQITRPLCSEPMLVVERIARHQLLSVPSI